MKVYLLQTTGEFFKVAFDNFKKENRLSNIERFSKKTKLGLSSLKMILSGKRRPTVSQVLSLARFFGLSNAESNYLVNLALKENAKDKWEIAFYDRNLSISKKDIKLTVVQLNNNELLATPKVLPLLIYFLEFNDHINYELLQNQLDLSRSQIDSFFSMFLKENLITEIRDNTYHINLNQFSSIISQKNYQKKLLQDIVAKVDKEYENPKSIFLNYVLCLDETAMQGLRIDIKELLEKYMSNSINIKKKKYITQACIQIFPVIVN
ncbi:MAG: hypothetical protein J0M15_11770 [Deltaproteobacteria bacterium]|nr:hypothetical protein [Deltaproteobacteria bacterium]